MDHLSQFDVQPSKYSTFKLFLAVLYTYAAAFMLVNEYTDNLLYNYFFK